MRTMAHFLRGLIVVFACAGVLAYAAAAVVTVADIVGRQVGAPIPGVVDLVQLFVVGGAWLVIPYAFLTRAHVGVDLLVESFPKAAEQTLRIVASVTAMVLVALMLFYCYEAFQQQLMFGDRSQQLGIPIIWYWVPLLVGMALSMIATLLTIFTVKSTQSAS
ncbi:MAG: transporter small permease subunit [Microvirga sp.]|jgi:TRAP-type C4-dicarboxylate transport system permease small subunit|nr:transporter small permease subunit [Microvirga sp.]MCD6070858.1 transporter small permease subunit [Microvirga sp.]MDF2969802.1 transporter small permease subunit [Microvirga sp.]